MEPFMDIRSLTSQPGRLKCVWVTGADGQLESIWVPNEERQAEVTPLRKVEPVRKPGRRAG